MAFSRRYNITTDETKEREIEETTDIFEASEPEEVEEEVVIDDEAEIEEAPVVDESDISEAEETKPVDTSLKDQALAYIANGGDASEEVKAAANKILRGEFF